MRYKQPFKSGSGEANVGRSWHLSCLTERGPEDVGNALRKRKAGGEIKKEGAEQKCETEQFLAEQIADYWMVAGKGSGTHFWGEGGFSVTRRIRFTKKGTSPDRREGENK